MCLPGRQAMQGSAPVETAHGGRSADGGWTRSSPRRRVSCALPEWSFWHVSQALSLGSMNGMELDRDRQARRDSASRPRRGSRLLAEGALVMFAVLVALAVDEWWEERENADLADRATQAIIAEIRRNREELAPEQGATSVEEGTESLRSALESYERGEEPDGIGVNWNVGLLSSAAWNTAQVTRATQFMPLDRVVDLAQVYEFQAFYAARQDDLVSLISDLESRIEADPVGAIKLLLGRYNLAHSLRNTLDLIFACALVDLDAAIDDESRECDEARSGSAPAADIRMDENQPESHTNSGWSKRPSRWSRVG